MLSAVGAEFLGVSDEPIGVDDRRIVFVTIIAIEPSEDDADVVFIRRLEFLASPCRQIDVCGKGAVAGDEQSEGKCSREDFHGGPPANLMLGLCSILLRRVQLNASF